MQQDKYAGLGREEKYTLLTRDFLDRDGDTFVRIRREGRLGWEETLPTEGEYSPRANCTTAPCASPSR